MYYVNGHYVTEADAKISILDLAILRGFGVFDYLRTYNGRPFHLWDHLLRLKYSAQHVGLSLPKNLSEIQEIIETVQKHDEASIKIIVTGGVSPDHFTLHESNLIVFAYPLTPYPLSFFDEGIKVSTTRLSRPLPTSKTIQYMPAIVAIQQSKAQEALYLNAQGEILEATTSNFFAFKDDTLYTCTSDEVLHGITLEVVLRLCAPHFPLKHQALRYQDIPAMQEAFITASNKEVMPVVQIDGAIIGSGTVGPRTKKIMELFRTYTQSANWPALKIPRYFDFNRQPFAPVVT
jgi:branched-chain amino acid aminotransferase